MSLYSVTIDFTPTVLSQGTSYWAMQNGSTGNRIFIREFSVMSEFSGTVALSVSKFGLYRFSGGPPVAGGGAGLTLSAAKFDSTNPASSLQTAVKNSGGITMTGTTVETTNLLQITVLNQLLMTGFIDLFGGNSDNDHDVCLNPGEGLVLQANNTLVAGIALHGFVTWAEAL